MPVEMISGRNKIKNMKNLKLILIVAGLVATCAPVSLLAQDATTTPNTNRPAFRQGAQQRGEFMKSLGLDPQEMKGLTPEQRQAKMKEAIDKKMTELQKKKADGTITEQEQTQLDRLQKMKDHTGHPHKDAQKPADKQ
jgi:hypothetical protein